MKKIYVIVLFGLCAVFTSTSYSDVVFETNFDNIQTWKATHDGACWQTTPIEGGKDACDALNGALPHPFNDYRAAGSGACGEPGKNVISIGGVSDFPLATGFSPFGGTGKAYLHWYEPCPSSSGSWGSDGLIGVYFGKRTGYAELYVQMKIRFQQDLKWAPGAQQKLLHLTHFDEDPLSPYDFFTNNMPDMVPGIYHNPKWNPNPQYYLSSVHTDRTKHSEVNPIDINVFDGNWHTVEIRVKLNSAAEVADGIKAMWLDGKLVASYTNVPWTKSNTPNAADYGFNRVIIGGNSSNYHTGDNEQWYALDDLVVSTTSIGTNYVIDGGSGESTIAAPTNLSVE